MRISFRKTIDLLCFLIAWGIFVQCCRNRGNTQPFYGVKVVISCSHYDELIKERGWMFRMTNTKRRPTLIYDGHCNLCIGFVKTVEPINRTEDGDYRIALIPYQKADDLIAEFNLDPKELQSAFHLIDENGTIYKAGKAIDKLAGIYPLLKIGSGFFTTEIGEKFYAFIAENRYSIFGCTDECYVSEFYESEQKA